MKKKDRARRRARPLASARVGAQMVPLDDLTAHPLNANVMSEELQAKLTAHIKRTGRYPFLVVRPHLEQPGKFQVLDGHHRVDILRSLGHREARCDVWDVDDREAKLTDREAKVRSRADEVRAAGDAGRADVDADADADDDGVGRWCPVRPADGLGDSEAGTLATPAWKGCPAQDPADPLAAGSHGAGADGVAVTFPVADAGAGAEPRVR